MRPTIKASRGEGRGAGGRGRAGVTCQRTRRGQQKMKSIGEISIAAPSGGFREFSSRGERKKGSRRSRNIVARRGGGTDCRRARRSVFRARCAAVTPKPTRHEQKCGDLFRPHQARCRAKTPVSTKLRKTLRRNGEARVSSAWSRAPSARLDRWSRRKGGAAVRKTTCRKMTSTMATTF